MDYIRKKIEQRIDFLMSIGDKSSLKQHYQARFEYILIYLLSYLWNKNSSSLDREDKEFVFKKIIKPTIGDIVQICRKLDISKEILKNGRLSNSIEKYTPIRNEKIGHGYVFEDKTEDFLNTLDELYGSVLSSSVDIFSKEIDLVFVTSSSGGIFRGINFKADGASYLPWSCPREINDFQENNLYGFYEGNYFRISPFIEIQNFGQEIYCFSSIAEKLIGKIKYNRLVDTGTTFREWSELSELDIENDGIKQKSANGTIRNVYENNFKKYIDIGIKEKVFDFLLKNKSSACATIWGHGGVGKTATIQSVCDDLSNDEKKKFDYVVFLSAKDRRYNYYTGTIEEIDERVSTLEDILRSLNKVIFDEDSTEPNNIFRFKGKFLLVIDDFETFTKEEKEKISNFILSLDINYNKVVITTRANIIIGQELQTNELTQSETKRFLLEVITNEQISKPEIISKELDNEDNLTRIYEITSGRPLFIFQYAFILGQKGSISETLKYNIKESQTAINFLYGRIYDDYLTPKAKDLFVILSLLVTNDDLSNVLEKAKYILNLEHDEDVFNSAVKELIKLKIIKIDDENKFFEIYSKEILQIMNEYFQKRNDTFKRGCIARLSQVNKDRTLDVEHSLLLNANSNRLAKNEIEVIENYKQIINRPSSPTDVKLTSVLNLSAYLVDRGKKETALRYLDEYSHLFAKNSSKTSKDRSHYALFTKMWATYYWANGTKEQKEKAIDILLSFAASGFNYQDSLELEISGLLLTYRSLLLVNDWQDLKEKRKYNEISHAEFTEKRTKQKQVCKDIHDKQGIFLYNSVTQKKFDEMASGAKQNIISGLYQFIEILVRLEKFELAKEICEYVLWFGPKHFHQQFKSKQSWLEYILLKNSGRSSIPKKSNNEPTDLGIILSDAMKRNKKNDKR